MIVHVDGRQMVMCDSCYRRFEVPNFPGASMAHKHVCDECTHKPRIVPASGAWCGTPALSRTWAQGQEGV